MTASAPGREEVDGAALVYDALGRMVEGYYEPVEYLPDGCKLAIMSGQSGAGMYFPLPGGASAGNSARQMSAYAYVANQPLNATDPLGLTPFGPATVNLTCLTCPDQDFWYGGGFDVNPG
ncbi:MAG: hypothetical protein ACRD13_05220, partial [Terriglobales bacterium]